MANVAASNRDGDDVLVIVELNDLDADREREGQRVRELLAPERHVHAELAAELAPERGEQQHQPKRRERGRADEDGAQAAEQRTPAR